MIEFLVGLSGTVVISFDSGEAEGKRGSSICKFSYALIGRLQ